MVLTLAKAHGMYVVSEVESGTTQIVMLSAMASLEIIHLQQVEARQPLAQKSLTSSVGVSWKLTKQRKQLRQMFLFVSSNLVLSYA